MRTKTRRRGHQKAITLHGWEGTGDTLALARADAIAKSEQAAKGNYAPTICMYKGMVGICWREPPDLYVYTIARPNHEDTPKGARKDYFTSARPANPALSLRENEDLAVRDMCNHLAQNGFNPETDDWTKTPEILKDHRDACEFMRWAFWQAMIVEAKRQGITEDAEYRKYADAALAKADAECNGSICNKYIS